jgi:hypothetical protein
MSNVFSMVTSLVVGSSRFIIFLLVGFSGSVVYLGRSGFQGRGCLTVCMLCIVLCILSAPVMESYKPF